MNVPVYLLLPGQFCVTYREEFLRNPWRQHYIDESIPYERTENLMDVERKGCEREVVSERLDSLAEPWYRWDNERVVHRSERGAFRRREKDKGAM